MIDKGVVYMLIASGISAFSGMFAKILTQEISSLEVVFFRNIFGVIIVSFALLKSPAKSIKGEPFLLFTRGFLGFVGIIFFFYTIKTLPLGVAITLNKTSPIFGAIFSFLFISEKLKIHQVLAMLIGFFGIVFIFRPFEIVLDINMLIGLSGGVVAGLAYTSIRKLRAFYDTREILFSFSFFGFLFSLFLLIISEFIVVPDGYEFMFGTFVVPDMFLWIWITLLGFSGTASQYFMTKAYEHTKTGIVGTVAYLNIPFAIFLGVLLGDNFPSLITIIGISLVIISGILINFKSNKG